jgi:hypothetical protein
VIAARILIVDFIVCTLAVKKKKNQGRFLHVGSDHSLVSVGEQGAEENILTKMG